MTPRFTLRALLVACSLACVAAAIVGDAYFGKRRQERLFAEAEAALRADGAGWSFHDLKSGEYWLYLRGERLSPRSAQALGPAMKVSHLGVSGRVSPEVRQLLAERFRERPTGFMQMNPSPQAPKFAVWERR
ncbi:MAG: hypothetical protein U0836_12880 [Pirellulales bacterium]